MAVFHFSLQFAAQGETHHVLATKFQPGEWAQILPRAETCHACKLSFVQFDSNLFQQVSVTVVQISDHALFGPRVLSACNISSFLLLLNNNYALKAK